MTRKFNKLSAAILTAFAVIFASCEKTNETKQAEEPKTNYFTFEEYTFEINSVVQYDKGDNNIELWLSSEKGLTTTEAVENAGEFVVLNTNKQFLGKRDRFYDESSKGSFIRFNNQSEFAYGDTGSAYIEVSITSGTITLDFMAQNMYTKAQPNVCMQGNYTGTFSIEKEIPYENEWGVDRKRKSLGSSAYLTSAEANTLIKTFEEDGSEAVSLSIKPSLIGIRNFMPYTGAAEDLVITYNSGQILDLKKATGLIYVAPKDDNLEINIDVMAGPKRMRVAYNGRWNRFKYDYAVGQSQYEGTNGIAKLMVKKSSGNKTKFYFSPSEDYHINNNINKSHMPILTVPTDIINAGKKKFSEIADWEFVYDLMEVWPFENEYRPYPATEDNIEIIQMGNYYEIKITLASLISGSTQSSIDIYYKGSATE